LFVYRLFGNKMLYIDKPWGHEEIWASNEIYTAKRIYIEEGLRTSRHYHEKKIKSFWVIIGSVLIETGPDHDGDTIRKVILETGDSYHIPAGFVHRVCATVDEEVELIEVSNTEDPNDIIRLEDDFGRIPDLNA